MQLTQFTRVKQSIGLGLAVLLFTGFGYAARPTKAPVSAPMDTPAARPMNPPVLQPNNPVYAPQPFPPQPGYGSPYGQPGGGYPVPPAGMPPNRPMVTGPGFGPPNQPVYPPGYPSQNPAMPGGKGSQPPLINPAARVPSNVYVPPLPSDATSILLILDASYSMTEKLDEGESKMAIAKRVLLDTLQAIPPQVFVGLRVYGLSANPLTACSASQLLVPFNQNNRRAIANAILGIRPTGETPISFSLQQGIQKDLAYRPGKKTVVLVTDGIETCDADPCRVAVQLVRQGSDVKINTVALGLARNYDALRQLKCISAATYGRFYTANTSAELARGLASSFQVTTNVQAQILPKFKP